MNNLTTPADFDANAAVHPIREAQAFARAPKVSLSAPDEFVTIVRPSEGVFAPVLVTVSVESALALAVARLLPGPATILATLSVEGLAALRLPVQLSNDGYSLQNPGRVVFAPDEGLASLRAAQYAARRARLDGWSVDLLLAPRGSRWADVLLGRVRRPEDDLARIQYLWVPHPEVDPRESAWEPVYDFDEGTA